MLTQEQKDELKRLIKDKEDKLYIYHTSFDYIGEEMKPNDVPFRDFQNACATLDDYIESL